MKKSKGFSKKLIAGLAITGLLVGTMGSFAACGGKGVADMSNENLRKAISYAIDYNALATNIYGGNVIAAGKTLVPDGDSYQQTGLTNYTHDVAKAKEYVQKAIADGAYKKGTKLKVVYYYSDNETKALLKAVQSQLKEAGISMEYVYLEESNRNNILWTPGSNETKAAGNGVDWDMAYAAKSAMSISEYYATFTSGASNNSHTPIDLTIDSLFDEANSTMDTATQIMKYKELQTYMNEHAAAVPMYYAPYYVFYKDISEGLPVAWGNEQFTYNNNILNWKLSGGTELKTNGGPGATGNFEATFVNPGISIYQDLVFDRLLEADASLTAYASGDSAASGRALAKSYTISEDGKKITLELRDSVKWSNGDAFTATDVVDTIKASAMMSGLNSVASTTYSSIKGMAAWKEANKGKANLATCQGDVAGIIVNGNSVTLEFDSLDTNATITLSQFPILPSKALQNMSFTTFKTDAFWGNPYGTGPFKVGTKGENTTLVKNQDYYVTDAKGNIDKITMTQSGESDGNIQVNAKAGKYNFVYSKSTGDIKALTDAGLTRKDATVRYTRLFYFGQFKHSNTYHA